MYPSRPSSTDPNAAYRDAIAAFADNRMYGQEDHIDDEPYNEAAQNQSNSLAGLNPRRTTNQDRLNAIAHNLGSGVRVAMEMITSNTIPAATTDVATSSAAPVTVDTIRQYLSDIGHHGKYIANDTIQRRLNEANLSTETLLTAIQTAHNPNHPLWATLGAGQFEREAAFYKLSGIVTNKSGFRDSMKTLVKMANNNPEQLVANVLQFG